MSRLVKYSDGLLIKDGNLQRDAGDIGEPDPGCCCAGGGCPPGGLCPCPTSGEPPLFITGWPGELAVGPASIYCEAECSYNASSNGVFECPGESGSCSWAVSICAQITCNTIDEETGCGSDCTLSAVTVTVIADSCECPEEISDTSGFNYFYCP
jgi:hypothetical protein